MHRCPPSIDDFQQKMMTRFIVGGINGGGGEEGSIRGDTVSGGRGEREGGGGEGKRGDELFDDF